MSVRSIVRSKMRVVTTERPTSTTNTAWSVCNTARWHSVSYQTFLRILSHLIILFNFALSVGKMKLECISLSLTRKMIDGTERYRLRVDPSGCSISGHSFVCNRQLSQTCTKFFFFFKHH